MILQGFTEPVIEEASLTWLEGLGYAVEYGPDIALGAPAVEQSSAEAKT